MRPFPFAGHMLVGQDSDAIRSHRAMGYTRVELRCDDCGLVWFGTAGPDGPGDGEKALANALVAVDGSGWTCPPAPATVEAFTKPGPP